MGRRVKMMLGSPYEGWRPGVKEGGVYYDGDPNTTERALIVTGGTAPGEGRDLGREKRILLSLRHPNVLRLLSLALAPGRREPVYAYAYTQGVSLARLMRVLRGERGLLPWGVVVGVVSAVSKGVQAVVDATTAYPGYRAFHAGPTPDDILIDDQGCARASGFEVWKAGSLTRSSPGYGCPEEGLSGSCLVYALGALLVEMLSGERPPLPGRTAERHREVVRRVQVKVLARPGDRLPEGLVDVVADCLDFEPERRPALAGLTDRLERIALRAPAPTLAAWSARVVPALRTGEPLTESVMAADPRLGMAAPIFEEDHDPDCRPTTIDPERAAQRALLEDSSEHGYAERDSMHGVMSPFLGSGHESAWEPDSDVAPTVPLEPRDFGTERSSPFSLNPGPSNGQGPRSPEPVFRPPPAQPEPVVPSRPAPEPEPEAVLASPPRPAPRDAGSRPLAWVGMLALVLLAAAIGWLARGIGPAPAPPPPAAPKVSAPPEPPTPAPAPAPEEAEVTPVPPAPEAAPPTEAPPPAPGRAKPAPSRAPDPPKAQPAPPAEPKPAPEAAAEPAAPPAPFEVVFRSADPTVTEMSVKCHAGRGTGTSSVTIADASAGPCRVTATRGATTVQAMVAVSGPRTYTCFAGGSRGCR